MTDKAGGGKAEEEVKGTLICGADGAVYFIPSEDLEAYRVPEEHAAPVREGLRQPGREVQGFIGSDYNSSGIIIVGGVTARRVWGLSPTLVPGVVYRSR
jgi:hypothetical protein